jgi:hypothetical protein
MQISPKYKKWIYTFLILLIARLVISIILYFAIEYNFKQILQVFVKRETKGTYRFESATIEVSLWNRSMIVDNAAIVCNDTLHTTPHYDVQIPKIYLTIQSWEDLIFHQTFAIDSLALLSPTIKVHEHREQVQDSAIANFHVADIMTALQKTLVHLRVRALVLQDGSFTYDKINMAQPLVVDHVNFSILNFTKANNDSSHLFSSDDIELSINDQHWALPDGFHNIKFKNLHFSGKDKLFELDSCYIHTKARANKGEITLTADKLFFNSAQLSAIYEKQQLIIDTLICIKPILTVPGDNKDTVSDSKAIKKSTDFIFDYINFNYIDIEEGQLSFTNKNKPSYGTQKANLKVYNLQVNPDSSTKIEADSILFNVKDLKFITRDSLFQLAVDEFIFKNGDLIFNHAVFGPTQQNRSGKGIAFSTPALYLKNISLDALVEKKIKATEAFVYDPIIYIAADPKKKRKIKQIAIDNRAENSHIYKTLHGVSELLDVDNFHIINGNLQYKLSGTKPATITMKNVSADILLHHLFLSDSLIDIKRSMPTLDIGQIGVKDGNIDLLINNYRFKGSNRHNNADNFLLNYGNNLVVKGTQLSWEIFDWDQYVNYRKFMVDHIQVNTLSINSKDKEAAADKSDKDLPFIHIGRLDVDNLDFTKSSVKNNMHLSANTIRFDNINSVKRFFIWNDGTGIFNNIQYADKNMSAFVKKVTLNNNYTNVIEGATIDWHTDSGYTKLELPSLKIKGDLHSSDFSADKLSSFIIDNPTIAIYNTAASKKTIAPFLIPLDFNADNIIANNAHIQYVSETKKDTLSIIIKASITADGLHVYKDADNMLDYKKVTVTLSDLSINENRLSVNLPRSSLILDNGALTKNNENKLAIVSGVFIKWDDAAIKCNTTDSTEVAINNLSGSFEDKAFSSNERSKYKWQYLLSSSAIDGGSLHLKGKTQTINIRSYSWLPEKNTLHIEGFDVTPNLGMEETFKKEKWQADYMVIKGDAITVNDLRVNQQKNDSSITADKIIINNVSLTASRDKKIPFHHSIEKPMPTKLISAIAFPFSINTVVVENSSITIQEISAKTDQMGIIPLKNINGIVSNLSNINNQNKNLTINATGSLFNTSIRHFYYSERYDDSLSNFTLSVNLSPINFVELNPITKPLAAVEIEKGSADTLFANWRGNKYAAIGKMNLYYKDLAIKILNPANPAKNSLKLRVENSLAGNLIDPSNKKETLIFFERDREKFIFNDWIKTILKGTLSSIGLQKDNKYIKHYNKLHKTHPLPPMP